jgi:hypothetical protein
MLAVEPLMTAELDDTHSLRARARRPAVLACALTAAVLAPLVDWLLIEEVLTNHEDPPLANVLAYPAWSPAMAGLLGGLVAIVALRDVDRAGTPSPLARVAATVGLGAVAGVLHLGLLAMASLPAEVASRGVEGLECIVGAAMLGTIGAIVSAPMGAAFGVLFVLATGPAAWCAARPLARRPPRGAGSRARGSS